MKFKSFSILLVVVVIAVLVFTSIYYVWQSRNGISFLNPQNTNSHSQMEVQQVVSRVGKLMLLPSETPVLAKVTDPSKLGGQVFFKNASPGDLVLMYKIAKEAILYNPAKNLIINVGPLNVEEPTPTAVIITKSSTARVIIYYNPDGQGYDGSLENQLAKEANIDVTKKSEGTEGLYTNANCGFE